MRDGGEVFRRAFLDGLRPDPQLTVSEWADRHRVLAQMSSFEYGPFRTDRTPYMREIMDSLSDTSPVEKVVFMKGSQIGGSEGGYNWIGYTMHTAPAPMLLMVPRDDDGIAVSRTRIDPMVEASPALRDRVSERRERDAGNSRKLKEFPGGYLKIVGTNSAANLKQAPIRKLFCDEIDEFHGDVGGQGDPIQLGIVRTNTYRTNRKIYMVSTPTVENRSRIWNEYQATDQRVYMVPCLACGALQEITWRRHIKWTDNNPATVYMECESCHAHIPEGHKTKMLAAGVWLPKRPDAPPHVRGYWLSALYSPFGWYSWRNAVEDFLIAKKNPPKLVTFINTVLAECSRSIGDAPEWERVYERREPYKPGTVPRGGLVLTMAVDTQGDRLEFEVVAWGRGLESWSVDKVVLPGKPTEAAVWEALDREMSRTFPNHVGVEMRIAGVGVDSGDGNVTQDVYRWARRKTVGTVFVLKGTDDATAIVFTPKAVEVQHQGKRLKRGVRVWHVGGPAAKSELYGFLRLPKPTDTDAPFPPGYCHFPDAYPREFFEQLTAEQVVPRRTKEGYTRFVWEKIRERNEALDCRVYNRAVASILGLDRYTDAHWDALEATLGVVDNRPRTSTNAPAPTPAPRRPRTGGGGYLQRWER